MPSGIMCIEVAPDQSVISKGEEAGEVWCVVVLAGACGRNVDVDDSQFRPVNLDHNALVLEVGVVWEQVVEVEFLVWERVVDQGDETTTTTCCSVFSYGGIIWEGFYCVGGCEVCFLDDGNQDVMFLEEILELFVRVLDAISVEL